MLKRGLFRVKTSIIFLASMFLFILIVNNASAANLLTTIFKPFAGFDMGALYKDEAYRPFIDFVLYLIFFIGVSQFALGKRFSGKGAGAIKTTLGIILAIALVVWERTTRTYLITKMGPIVALIFILILAYLIFYLISHFGMNKPAAVAIALLIAFYAAKAITPSVFVFMEKNEYIGSIIGIALVVLWIIAIWSIIRGAIHGIRGTGGGGGGLFGGRGQPPIGGGPAPPGGKSDLKREEGDLKKAGKELQRSIELERRSALLEENMRRLQELERNYLGREVLETEAQEKLTVELLNLVRGMWDIQGALVKVLKGIKEFPDNREYYEQAVGYVKNFDLLAKRLLAFLSKLDEHINKEIKEVDPWLKKIEDRQKKVENLIKRYDRRDMRYFIRSWRDLKKDERADHKYFGDVFKAKAQKGYEQGVEMYENFVKNLNQFRELIKKRMELKKKMKDLDRNATGRLHDDLNYMSGLRGLSFKLAEWRAEDLKRVFGIGTTFMMLREQDMRKLYTDLDFLLQNRRQKLRSIEALAESEKEVERLTKWIEQNQKDLVVLEAQTNKLIETHKKDVEDALKREDQAARGQAMAQFGGPPI